MNEFARPLIFASRCLGFERCRWNGETVNDPLVDKLRKVADFITLCPERDIGLGIPRDPIRVVERSGALRLMQPATAHLTTALKRAPRISPGALTPRSAKPRCSVRTSPRHIPDFSHPGMNCFHLTAPMAVHTVCSTISSITTRMPATSLR